jgi:hypothetical protein
MAASAKSGNCDGFPTYLGTATASDGTALMDLVLDRNPFMLANGPRRTARPNVLMVPVTIRSRSGQEQLGLTHTADR